MPFVAGLDMGSRIAKAVIVNENREIVGKGIVRTKPNFAAIAREVLDAALANGNIQESELIYVAATGFGRYNVPFRNIQITDITCAARGAAFLFPNTKCVLDIGFQSTRAIKLRDNGKVKEFRTNDKCAAGAGGFLERACRYLEVPLEEFGQLSLQSTSPVTMSSVCAVLAETEIINHVSSNELLEDIVAGVHRSLSTRSLALLKRVGMEPEVTFVAGVARQPGMVKALEETLQMKVNVSPEPHLVGALGAGILGWQRVEKAATTAA